MQMLRLPVVKGVNDNIVEYHETQTAVVPHSVCMELLNEIPKPFLQRLLPPNMTIHGFRTPARAPVRMIYEAIRDSHWLGFILSQYCVEVMRALSSQSVQQIRLNLPDLVEEYGPVMVRYALYVDRRKSVRSLGEQFPTLVNSAGGKNDREETNGVVVEIAATAATDAPPAAHNGYKADPIEPQPVKETGTDAHSALQKRLAKAEKLVAERDEQIRKLRQEKGERDHLLGRLRRELDESRRQVEQLNRLLAEAKQKVEQLRHLEDQLHQVAERERQLEARESAYAALFGADAADMKRQVLDGAVQIHDMESQLASLNMLLAEQYRQRDAILGNMRHVTHVPVGACISVVQEYLEGLLQQQLARLEPGEATAAARLTQVAAAQELLQAIAVLERLDTAGAEANAARAVEVPLDELKQQFDEVESVKLELMGQLRYEGPHVWLVTPEKVLGLPSGLLDQDDLVTGTQVRLTLYHDRNTLVDMTAEVVAPAESQVINDALRYGDDGLYVQSHYGQPVLISQYEFLRAQVEVGEPLQVVIPKWPSLKGGQALYGRIAKRLERSGVYLPPRREMNCTAKKTHGESVSDVVELPPLLVGKHVLVVGGDGNEQCYQTVVEGMGGRFDFQSGFEQLARIAGKVRSCDFVILVTGCVLHAVSELTQREAKRTNTPFYYFNSLGRTSFTRFIAGLYAGEWESGTAVG